MLGRLSLRPTSRVFQTKTRFQGHAPISPISRSYQSQAEKLQGRPPLAFAFDIDGVLVRGEEALPQAKRALRMLNGENKLGIKIPYIFITNGGGVSEKIRCRRLSEKLGVEVTSTQFMQAHTVLRSVVDNYANVPVLVLGGRPGDVPRVAEEYGFKKVYTTLDILAWDSSIWPFHSLDEKELSFLHSRPKFDPSTRFSGIFVFHDPRNWALDIQITCDILRNDGYVLPTSAFEISSNASEGGQEPVHLVFCNPDLLWGNDFPTPRLGQGGFRVAFQSVYRELTGKEYPYTQYGKPTMATYNYAEKLLRTRLDELYPSSGEGYPYQTRNLPNVYMVGDNPESDIAGANAKGWSSILVKTGVYNPVYGPPHHEPKQIVDDIEQAISWAIEQEISHIRK